MSPLRSELRSLWKLAAPLAVLQLAHSAIGAVGTAIVGRYGRVGVVLEPGAGERAVAAVGLGNVLYFAVATLGLGFVLGFDPLLAQAIGAGERGEARRIAWQAGWMSLLVSIPLTGALAAIAFALPAFMEQGTGAEARDYLLAHLPSLWPFLLAAAARAYLQARDIVRPLLVGAVVANVVHAPLAWWLALELGWGAAGAGWAASAGTLAMMAVLLAAFFQLPGEASARSIDPAMLRRAARVGGPLALQLFAEVGAFALATIFVGVLGERALASHHVALTLSSLSFQVALAIGAAASVRVGHAIGREDVPGTRRAGLTAIGAGAVFMAGCALLFVALPAELAGTLTAEPPVIAAAVPLLLVAAAFQIGDGIQAIAAGALRGAGDTRTTMLANLLGHYAIGLPVGLGLCFGLGWGASGLWWGLSAGLCAVGALLSVRFWRLSRRPIARA
ncbi:MAG TPA: MATE family efflux transporter [Polyangiaceae bacterium LLY-WYZ-15_(1-7)]|nr:MATE family efflux transporter [Polyangiaceae bacterium LLY-WYZ-15_(1-7)]HJL07529.1 MATE family efflux transporter [Polyangiaceae bacterium LLY-WYZ-15_(1-7)]HJL21075.1 MATE family efflux transporter [Polyangiaceae bacterium LLY-WYZ-15_(1-7)]HJL36564.1 MATE family efflux transporter [Polyangiaceae bacterium LLY-WYZ-15_(1-7)]HJL50121.1 MATE family efflux transporter [Polyangiaceae bacterium LLY-WYZ-15_(1-7)]